MKTTQPSFNVLLESFETITHSLNLRHRFHSSGAVGRLGVFKFLRPLLLTFAFTSALAQGQNTDKAPLIDINSLPKYVVIETDLRGRLADIAIDSRNSPYEAALTELEDLLVSKEKLRIQNRTDLLNTLSNIGFDYVNSFSVAIIIHTVFRKKPEYRQTSR